MSRAMIDAELIEIAHKLEYNKDQTLLHTPSIMGERTDYRNEADVWEFRDLGRNLLFRTTNDGALAFARFLLVYTDEIITLSLKTIDNANDHH